MDWVTFIGVVATLAFTTIGVALRFAIRHALCATQAAAQVELDLANFKTEVAKDYATARSLDKVQDRIMDELEKLNKKLDRLVEGRGEGR